MSLSQMVGGTSHTLVTLQVPVTANHLDGMGIVGTGELLKNMDIAACMSAERHSLRTSVTLSMDDVNFSNARAKPGDIIVIRSRVNRAFKTSMEIGLRVEIETPESHQTRHLCSSYFVFVALDENGNKVDVPPLTPLTDKEKVRWALAADRRQIRLDHAKIVQQVIKDKQEGLRYSMHPKTRGSVAIFGESDDRKNEVTHMVLPQHANHYGNTFGGQIMAWAHEVCAVAAARHARTKVVTVSVDDMYFLAPSKVGTRVVLKASVNRVFNRSMEVGVRVEGHHLNGDIVIISRAYFTMVAVDLQQLSSQRSFKVMTKEEDEIKVSKLSLADEKVQASSRGGFFLKKKKSGDVKASSPAPPNPAPTGTENKAFATGLPRTESKLGPLLSVPLNTPDQIRRHEEALGRRKVRLERLQIKRSNHLAWPFTPETNPRAFALENLRALEKVALESDSIERLGEDDEAKPTPGIPKSPTLNRGLWGLVAESEDVKVWSKTTLQHGISMKSQCLVTAPFKALVFAVWDVGSRTKWDEVVVNFEIRHRYDYVDTDIAWLAVDMRKYNATSKPTDFALLRSWRMEGSSFVIASHSVIHHAVPATSNYVRAETASSGFILTDLGHGKVDVQYVVQLNQSGTSIVAGDLVGTSKVYALRMKALVRYAKSLPSDVHLSMPVSNNTADTLASPSPFRLDPNPGGMMDETPRACALM